MKHSQYVIRDKDTGETLMPYFDKKHRAEFFLAAKEYVARETGEILNLEIVRIETVNGETETYTDDEFITDEDRKHFQQALSSEIEESIAYHTTVGEDIGD